MDIKNNVSRTFYKFTLQCKKHSPEILVVAGVVGVVASAVMACKATLKATEIVEEHNKKMELIHEGAELDSPEYTADDVKKDTVVVYRDTAIEFVKLYGPAVLLGAMSITGIVASNRILNKRNASIAAAYATVSKGFKEYRDRVVDRFGKDIDRELKYNIKAKEIEEVITDEKGKEKTKKKIIETSDLNPDSDYARYFDEYSTAWTRNSEANLTFLRQQQTAANQRLMHQGYLFLNDVYEMLGLQKTAAGQSVGWAYDPDLPEGENKIDFGIYDLYNAQKRAFVNGFEKSILLDFNVDGNILDIL